MGRRILVIAYTYPPMPSVGSNRWDSMARHLRALGHQVRILTTSAFGALDDPAEAEVVRTPDLIASPALRRVLRRPPLGGASGHPGEANQPAPEPMLRVVVPDPYLLSWVAPAMPSVRRQVKSTRPDCVITTSPYESGHLAALLLGRRRPPWIADFRDGWCFEPHRPPFFTAAQTRLDEALEARVARTADRVLAATRPIADDMRARLGVAAEFVPNGWDPALEASVGAVGSVPLDPRKRSLVYTGTLSGVSNRDPRGLLAGVRRLGAAEPGLGERFELVIAGHPGPHDAELIAAAGVEGLVRHVGRLPRVEALALQRAADAVALITSANGSEATGKLFEYLQAGCPIITLAEGSEAARIVAETGSGPIVAPDDEEAIAEQLRRLLSGELAAEHRPHGLERYVYPEPARQVAAIVEEIARR